MAVETTTKYVCDGCDQAKERGDLRRFVLIEKKMDNAEVAKATTELCTTCEGALHKLVFPLLPVKEREKLEGIVRG